MNRQCISLAAFAALVVVVSACGPSDAGIAAAVKTRLAADAQVGTNQINVSSDGGVVTLEGSVDSPEEKTRALEIARASDGVSRVVDKLRIETANAAAAPDAERTSLTDPALTAAVKSSLLADPMVRGLAIDVDTAAGVVTLSGDVRTRAEKDHAVRVARETPGVRDVADRLSIKP